MTHDGKILARVRQELADERRKNAAELERRTAEVNEKIPQLRDFDGKMAKLMLSVVKNTVSGGGVSVERAREEADKLLAERRSLLTANGFSADYLDEHFSCEKCRDTGYVEGLPCSCLEEKYAQESARALSRMLDLRGQSFESFCLDYYPDEYDASIGESPRSAMGATCEFCRRYAESFKKGSPNLLFRGGTGLGKTFLSAAIARVVSQKGFSVVYDTAISILDVFETLKFSKIADELPEYREAMGRYLSCDLLIFDDLGTEMTTSMTVSALYTIINTRLISGKSTIISTNLTSEELKKRYSQQIVSRLEGEYAPVRFFGRDIRLIKNEM